MKSIVILGSTGSIGVQALALMVAHPDRFSVFALVAHRSVDLLFEQCQRFRPRYAVLTHEPSAMQLSQRVQQARLATRVLSGSQAIDEIVADDSVHMVLSAIAGSAALLPTMAAIRAGKQILLANKESLVMAGDLMISAAKAHAAPLIPIDSEHNASFQCFSPHFSPGAPVQPRGVQSITLTASGGPFRLLPLQALETVSPEEAVAHPNWAMGPKISVDSATMMNKGLEVIEAHYLFGLDAGQIDVLIHPRSLVHALVYYIDGSTVLHLAQPDMRVPIAHAMAWPDRIDSGVAHADLHALSQLEFERPDEQRYPCLPLAYQALRAGGTAPTLLNAANEIAVSAFLSGQLPFTRIAGVTAQALEHLPVQQATSLDVVLNADQVARRYVCEMLRLPS